MDRISGRVPATARFAIAIACACACLLVLGAGAPSALGHGDPVPGLSEAELREVETKVLGPEHAAEHAEQRAIEERAEELGVAEAGGARASGGGPAYRVDGPPAQIGQWGNPFAIPIFGIHAVMLPTGKVMWWSYPFDFPVNEPRRNTAQAWLWNPATGTSSRVDPPINPTTGEPGNIWCSGQMLLADGRVLVTGGNLGYQLGPAPNDWKGLNKVYTFNPFNETWTSQPDMPHGRWYPSQVLQPDGRVVIMDGYDEYGAGAKNNAIELFTPSPNMNGVGTLQTISTRGQAGQPTAAGELYPRNFLMPSGRTLVAGPDPNDSWWYQLGSAPSTALSWGEIPNFNNGTTRLWSASVLEPGGPAGSSRVTITGGSPSAGATFASAETYDEANPGAGWQPAPSLNVARSHFNEVLLPDGSKVAVGGGVGDGPQALYTYEDPQRQIEIFDPATNSWRLGPSQAEGRAYHSTAVLLPDGRVISAGDNFNGGDREDSAEIYSPPYLFKGARPAISSAPASVTWGDTFGVYSPDPVSRAVLMAPAATTHGYDMNQRHVELAIAGTKPGVGLDVAAPPTAAVAPPGYYMLFLLNAQGVPSVAQWVRVDAAAPNRPPVSGKAVAKAKGAKVKGKNLIVRVSCDLPAGSADPCSGKISATAKASGGKASAKKKGKRKKKVLAEGPYSVAAGSSVKVVVKLTKRGRSLARKPGRVKVTITLTNELNDASFTTRAKV